MADLVIMPKLGFDMAEGTLVRWVKAEGDAVEKGELLAEIETDKATVEVESSHGGVVRRHIVSEGAIVPVGEPIAVVGVEDEEIDLEALLGQPATEEGALQPAPAEATPAEPASRPVSAAAGPRMEPPSPDGDRLPEGVRATPIARRIAADQGVDLGQVTGSGPRGRIVKSDIEAYLEQLARVPAVTSAAGAPVVAVSTEPREDQLIPLSRLRAAIGRRMVDAKQNLPHFYVTHEFEMAPVMALRRELNAVLEPEGVKLSVNDFVVKAVALSLRAYPNLNASLEGENIRRHGDINVGVAVAVENGLLTVVCQQADFKSLRQISSEVRAMAGRAREGKVRPDDVEGSTFTVSNLGMFEVEDFIAIINPPEAAILAVSSVRQVPVVAGGEIVVGERMKATISVDHRVSDGAEAAQYLQALAKYLEEPLRLVV